MTNKDRLLAIAAHLEGEVSELLDDTGLIDATGILGEDIKDLRRIAEEICPDGCDGG